jgi:hypothetical protein
MPFSEEPLTGPNPELIFYIKIVGMFSHSRIIGRQAYGKEIVLYSLRSLLYGNLGSYFALKTESNNLTMMCRIRGSQSGDYEEFCLLECNAVSSAESQPMFRRNVAPLFSGSKNRLSKKRIFLATLFMLDF